MKYSIIEKGGKYVIRRNGWIKMYLMPYGFDAGWWFWPPSPDLWIDTEAKAKALLKTIENAEACYEKFKHSKETVIS